MNKQRKMKLPPMVKDDKLAETTKAKSKAAARTKAEPESPKFEPTLPTDTWFEFSGVLPATITREHGFGCRIMTMRAFAERYFDSRDDGEYEPNGRMIYRYCDGKREAVFELPEWMDSTGVTLPPINSTPTVPDNIWLVGLKEDIEKIEELMDVHLNAVLDIRRLMAR